MKRQALLVGAAIMATAIAAAGAITAGVILLGDDGDGGGDDAQPRILRASPGAGQPSDEQPVILSSRVSASIPTGLAPPTSASTSTLIERRLTLRSSASATAQADQAFVVAMLSPRGPGGPPPFQLPTRDQDAIVEALSGMGVDRERIEFSSDPRFGPFPSVIVEVPVSEVQSSGKNILDEIERVAGRAQTAGVRFGLSDCNSALEPVRRQAFESAQTRAAEMAEAASLALGDLAAIFEQQTPSPYGPSQDPCSPPGAKTTGALLPLDAPAEVPLNLDLSVTYSIGEATAEGGLTVIGSGSVTAEANEAYIVVLVPTLGGPAGPEPVSTEDRNSLIQKLRDLGLDEEDIELTSPVFGGPTYVSVEVEIDDLAEMGDRVVDATEDVFGRGEQSGVYFSHTNCLAVLAEAQKMALADADNRAKSLGSATAMQTGSLLALSDSLVQQSPYGIAVDPCNEDLSRVVAGGPYGLQLKPFDSEPEFEVSAALSVTYGVSP